MLSAPLALLGRRGALISLAGPAATAQSGAAQAGYGLKIPTGHPRLWWTPERLATARAWYSRNQTAPRRDDYLGYAFRYLMTGDAGAARTAIGGAAGLAFDTSRTSSNEARWYGEAAILIFDWVYDQFKPAERDAFVQRWNGYLEALSRKPWGGPEMPQSNYFWGYLRNELLWGIATYHENPKAGAFLEHALKVRWQGSFLASANGPARGGMPLEGSQYGRYLLQYASVPLMTAHLLGRPMFTETGFFKEALFWLIYSTTPAPTAQQSGGPSRWEIFPLGDDQFFRNGGSAESAELGTYMSTVAELWRDLPAGQYARQWLKNTGAARPAFVAAVERRGPEKAFVSLPLDYFAPGPQHLYARTSWERDATALHLQLGAVSGGSHEHADQGNWQIWRKGKWLSRETTGYSNRFAGYGGQGEIAAYHTPAHNGLVLNGKGMADGDRNGRPLLKRLESRSSYLYAAVDLTLSYRNDQSKSRHHRERDNPVAERVEREFVFLRPLETLVIFDRVYSNSGTMPAAEVTKAFLAHFEHPPKLDNPNTVLAVNGDQALRLITLVPAAPVRRVVAEGSPIGQHRLEVETKGSERSYFLHVLQARDASEADVTARVAETPQDYTVTVQHPKRGHARLTFRKEPSGAAGLRFSRTGLPDSVSPLLDRVQNIRVTDDGPVWEALPKSGSETDPPAEHPPQPGKRR
jgi:hypothetical protein